MVWGHPERAALFWLGDGGGYACSLEIEPDPEPIGYDYDEAESRHSRLTAAAAREIVREYVQSGRRSTRVDWIAD
jgi:hypothetical protein